MSVWFALPSARPDADKNLQLWRQQGYKVALYRRGEPVECDIHVPQQGEYIGWPAATNLLVRRVLAEDSTAEWIVTGGDDTWPDLAHTAEEIGAQCWHHFTGTFGVMQPTGDRWGECPSHPDPRMRSAYIDRICGSPWMGREFCQRMYQGSGPLCEEYLQLFADEELFEVAKAMGVLWQRRDLIHLHQHALRKPNPTAADLPDFAKPFAGPEHWQKYKMIFERRKRDGFPGSEPL